MILSPKSPRMPPPSGGSPRLADDEREFISRARVFGLLIALLFLGLIARLWYLQIAHGDDYRYQAQANQARRIRSRAPRGVITDANGVLLAANKPRFAVYASPDIAENGAALRRLASLLHLAPSDIQAIIAGTPHSSYDPLRIAIDVPMNVVTEVEENKPFLPGVTTEPEPVRWYPRGKLAAHLLGAMGRIDPNQWRANKDPRYFSDDFVGKTGIECQYEPFLHGTPGSTNVQIDARGRRVLTLGTTPAAAGGSMTLALDSRLQAAGETAMHAHNFTGAAVAIDPRTGGVLSMVSAPGYNPQAFATGIDSTDWSALNNSPQKPLIDRTVKAMYPPGSTFKPIVACAGLQSGALSTHSSAYCPGYLMLGRTRFGCWQHHGEVDFFRAIAVSCDVFFYLAGQKIGPDRMASYAKSFGLAQMTGIDMPSEDIGTIPSPAWKKRHFRREGPELSRWNPGDTLHMAIGQGDVLVTPLQMARATAALANGGDVLKPYVVRKITDSQTGRLLFENVRQVVDHVPVSAQNMDDVRQAMRQAVTNGTAKLVDFPEVAVAAKTGSAQVHGASATHGWFICFAPMDHPTIAIAAIVEHGGHGADSAGLVAKAMLQEYFHLKEENTSQARSD